MSLLTNVGRTYEDFQIPWLDTYNSIQFIFDNSTRDGLMTFYEKKQNIYFLNSMHKFFFITHAVKFS